MDPGSFLEVTLASAREARADGAPIHPQAAAAHAANESGFGTSQLSRAPHRNLFGVKAMGSANAYWSGSVVTLPTWEIVGGKRVDTTAAFRTYATYRDAFADYGDLIRRLYPSAADGRDRDLTFLAGLFLTGPRKWATDPAAFDKAARILAQHANVLYADPDSDGRAAETLVLADLTWEDRLRVLTGGSEVALRGAFSWRTRGGRLDARRERREGGA